MYIFKHKCYAKYEFDPFWMLQTWCKLQYKVTRLQIVNNFAEEHVPVTITSANWIEAAIAISRAHTLVCSSVTIWFTDSRCCTVGSGTDITYLEIGFLHQAHTVRAVRETHVPTLVLEVCFVDNLAQELE